MATGNCCQNLILMLLLFIAALAYAYLSVKIDEIQAAEAEEQTLLDTYREKESKARHLEEYRRQVAQMEVEFNALLDQLPKDTRVSELVEGINMTGVGSGIRFQDISIEPEVEQELFIEQPIRIAALESIINLALLVVSCLTSYHYYA